MRPLDFRFRALFCAYLGAAALGVCAVNSHIHAQGREVASSSDAQDMDADVAARVKQALHSEKSFDDRHVNVTVEHGQIVLTGFVQGNREVQVAGQIATKAAGTHKLVNHLSVQQNFPNAP